MWLGISWTRGPGSFKKKKKCKAPPPGSDPAPSRVGPSWRRRSGWCRLLQAASGWGGGQGFGCGFLGLPCAVLQGQNSAGRKEGAGQVRKKGELTWVWRWGPPSCGARACLGVSAPPTALLPQPPASFWLMLLRGLHPERDEGAEKLVCREPDWGEEVGRWTLGEPRASTPQVPSFKRGRWRDLQFWPPFGMLFPFPPGACLFISQDLVEGGGGHLGKCLESCPSSLPKCHCAVPLRASGSLKTVRNWIDWLWFLAWSPQVNLGWLHKISKLQDPHLSKELIVCRSWGCGN